MVASPTSSDAVAVNLLTYLHDRLAFEGLAYAEKPAPIMDGWETYIYRFRLRDVAGLAEQFTRPLILRVYSSPFGLPRLQREFAAQAHLHKLAYPVAEPLLVEEKPDLFGGPFMIMERLPGRTLLDLMIHRPWRLVDGPGRMADAHVALHRLPPEGFPAATEPFLARRLEEMNTHIKDYGLRGLTPGLDWLHRHRPEPPDSPSIIHLDFHPVNLMFDQGHFRGVLDWNEADVGDRHADVATTMVLIKTAPVEFPSRLERIAVLPGRPLLFRWYWRTYRSQLPLESSKLSYYIALAAFFRLLRSGMWLSAGPRVTGCKPSSMRYVRPDRLALLRNCFHTLAGVGVHF